MANFVPVKNYMFYCLDKLISKYSLSYPFLDVGCGIGDLSAYLGIKEWKGEAIDSSEIAIKRAKENLKLYPGIKVSKISLFEETGKFKTIFLWDVVEHIKNDEAALENASLLLLPGGYLLIAVPSNLKEWRWDDDFYGHYRRYSAEEIEKKIVKAGLETVVFWDFTFPIFWVMRRLYTYFGRHLVVVETEKELVVIEREKEVKTGISSTVNAWNINFFSNLLNRNNFLWRFLYVFQFIFFKNKLDWGYEMFILARKPI